MNPSAANPGKQGEGLVAQAWETLLAPEIGAASGDPGLKSLF